METPFPPFDPDGSPEAASSGKQVDTTRNPRLRDIPLRAIFPNVLTILAICSGLTAIRFAIQDRLELAIAAIILAAFLDGIDGRVARFLKSTSRFGAQMDSLADFVNFGVAPAMILYFTLLAEFKSLGWIVALIYAVCACLRLARFNVMLDMPGRPQWQNNFFLGVPAPAGAMVVLFPVYILLLGVEPNAPLISVAFAMTLGVGFLMVSSLPTFSGKEVTKSIRRDLVMPLLIAAVVLTGLVLTYPWETLIAVSLGYLASIPFAMHRWRVNSHNKTDEQVINVAATKDESTDD